jgi:hypothetical protein
MGQYVLYMKTNDYLTFTLPRDKRRSEEKEPRISGPSLQWGWTTATDDLSMFAVRFPVLTRHFLPTNEFHPSKTKDR